MITTARSTYLLLLLFLGNIPNTRFKNVDDIPFVVMICARSNKTENPTLFIDPNNNSWSNKANAFKLKQLQWRYFTYTFNIPHSIFQIKRATRSMLVRLMCCADFVIFQIIIDRTFFVWYLKTEINLMRVYVVCVLVKLHARTHSESERHLHHHYLVLQRWNMNQQQPIIWILGAWWLADDSCNGKLIKWFLYNRKKIKIAKSNPPTKIISLIWLLTLNNNSNKPSWVRSLFLSFDLSDWSSINCSSLTVFKWNSKFEWRLVCPTRSEKIKRKKYFEIKSLHILRGHWIIFIHRLKILRR